MIERELKTYLKKIISREWINQRLQAIQVRKELTDEWQNIGKSVITNQNSTQLNTVVTKLINNSGEVFVLVKNEKTK